MKHNGKARKKGRRAVKAYFEESERDDRLGKLAKKAAGEWYSEKHPKIDPDETAFKVMGSLLKTKKLQDIGRR